MENGQDKDGYEIFFEEKFVVQSFTNGSALLHFTSESKALTTVRNHFIVFETRAEFENYITTSTPGSQLLPYSDLKYRRAEAVLLLVWSGYKTLFPKETAQLPVPQIAIQPHNFLDANVSKDKKNPDLAPHAFFMGQRLLELTDDGLAGIMAHELTHLLFPHFQPKYYEAPLDHEPLGFQQPNNPQIERLFKELQSITRVVGPIKIAELNGLPAPIVYDGQLFQIIVKLAAVLGNSTNIACQTIQNPTPKWRLDLVRKYLSVIDQTIRMTDAQRAQLDHDTKAYLSDLRTCLGRKRIRLLEFLRTTTNKPIKDLEREYGEYAAIFDRETNVVDGIFATSQYGYRKLEDLQQHQNLERYRVYSDEEYCDDNSVRVLRNVGFRTEGIEEFFLNAMEDLQSGSKAECLALIEAGKTPPYGLITDTHHAICFRVYHTREFSKFTQNSGASIIP